MCINSNKQYKNSVFTFLFKEPDVLRELYCALKGVTLPADTPVVVNTLEGIFYMEKINDISFEIGGKLVVLIEHQSTINPNMALRLLMYIGRVYEKIIADKNIYSTRQLRIPRPEFFVLYNGVAPFPDEMTVKLSDMFESPEALGLPRHEGNPSLDLSVRIININEGKNEAIAKRCRILNEYSAFVAQERKYEKNGLRREEALKETVKYCQNHDILKEFLEKNASEVLNMLMTEWNWDDAKEVWQEEAKAEGILIGRLEGRLEGKAETVCNALAEGLSFEMIQKITGLDMDTIKNLQAL
jgi:hypothetical protein